MPVAKKDQTKNAGGKRKMDALINQANSWHQMKETKQLKPHQNPKRLPTCKHKVEKSHTTTTKLTKSQQSETVCNKGVDDYSPSDQGKNNCANETDGKPY